MARPILTYRAGGGTTRSVIGPAAQSATPGPGVNDGGTPILNYVTGAPPTVPSWPPLPSDLTYPECGIIQLVEGQSYIDVVFTEEKPDANWIFEDLQILNTTDPTPLNIWPGIVTEKSITGFRLQLDGLPDTDNYFLHWAVGGCATSDWVVSSGATATNFLQLTDTPDEYTGQAGMGVKVNAEEDGLEFGVVAGSGGGGVWLNVVDYGAVADCLMLDDIVMIGGSAIVDSTAYEFTEDDVGKYVVIRGAIGDDDGVSPLHATILSVSGGDATLSQATTSFPVGAHTPRMDFGTDNVDSFNNAINALPAGGTVFVPAGRYFIGASTGTHVVRMPTNGYFEDQFPNTSAGMTFRGDGMGTTKLFYSSALVTGGGAYAGHGMIVGLLPGGGYSGITLCDFSMTDLNDFATGNNGINVWGIDNFRMERVELINIKGNAALNYQGFTPHPPFAGTYGQNVWIDSCVVTGHAEAGYCSQDGFNIGNVRNLHFTNNTITGVLRHGFEGGGNCYNQFFTNNYIDMGNIGLTGLNPTGGNQTIVANNIILNVNTGYTGVDITTDASLAYTIVGVIVTGNYITGGQFGIKFQASLEAAAHDKYIVSDNWVEGCAYGIGTNGGTLDMTLLVHNNRFILTSAYVLHQAGTPATPASASNIISIKDNVVNAGVAMQNHSQYIGFNDAYQLKIEDNVVGGEMYTGIGPCYGNLQLVYSSGGGTIAAGAILTGLTHYPTLTNGGARVNDSVEVIPAGSWPKNLIYYGAVTAADTVQIWIFNPSGSSAAYLANDYIYYVVHRK